LFMSLGKTLAGLLKGFWTVFWRQWRGGGGVPSHCPQLGYGY
jgi:hypothetical protein